MSGFIEGEDRHQATLFPESFDEYIAEDSAVRVIDVFIDDLDISGLGFKTEPADTGRPGYHPKMMLKLYVYGYLNRVQSSRRLEREAQRNVELMWLTGRLSPPQLHVSERKGGHSTIYPLSANVGEAIIDYLRFGRPDVKRRDLFLNTMSPYRPIKHTCASTRAGVYIKAAGIKIRRPGSHTFRHSCVQRLVDADVPFKVIGDYVGHRVPASTLVYGKVAIHKLRALAIGEAEEIL